jgi:hypothetical protein
MKQNSAIEILGAMPEVRLKRGIQKLQLPPKKQPKALPADAGEAQKRAAKVARVKS